MKSIPVSTIVLVVVASLVTLIASVFISVNYYIIKPKDLAKAIKSNPETFAEAVFSINDAMRKVSQKKRAESEAKKLETSFEKPVKLSTKGRVTFGEAKAPVTIVEFADFQCYYCSQASKSMKKLVEKYNGKVNLVYKHFPLGFHPFANPAAAHFEAIAMEDHEKAKKFHDLIFDNFEKYAKLNAKTEDSKKEMDKRLKELVKAVGADAKKLKENLKKAQAIVDNDKEEGEKAGVTGTPNFVINGVLVPRTHTPEEIIDRHLKKLKN